MASHNQPPAQPEVLPGDIVQVTDREDRLFTALLVVEGVRHWGIQAYAPVPTEEGVRPTYHRLTHGKFTPVGTAAMVDADVAQARKDAIETARLIAKESTREGE